MTNETTNTPPFKVKCVYIDNDCLTVGKEYNAVEVDDGFYKVKNDSGEFWWYHNNRFQIVETLKDKQEFSVGDKVVINKISDGYMSYTDENVKVGDVATVTEVGDKVYKYGETDVKTVLEVFNDGYMNLSNYPHSVNHESICNATQDNYEMLCKLYPHIEFELPPKEITGSDLCRAMLDKGWHLVPCVVSDISDSDALNNDNCCLVDEWWVGSFDSCFNSGDYSYKYAVPFDPKTGIPLTEDVLNETI